MQISRNELEDIYDRLCTALTDYEEASEFTEYDAGAELYTKLVDMQGKIQMLLYQEDEESSMYCVSCLIQNEDGRVWKCSAYDVFSVFQEAKELVEKYRENFTVLAAWITAGENIRFFECYTDISGDIRKPNT